MAVVFDQGLVLTLIATSVGVDAALPAARALTQLLFGISPLDATTFCSSVVLLGLMSVAASVIPALRSVRLPENIRLAIISRRHVSAMVVVPYVGSLPKRGANYLGIFEQ
jgi:hypothetical protein